VSPYNAGAVDYLDKIGGATQVNLAAVEQDIIKQSYMMSLNDYFYMLGCLFFVLIGLIWFIKGPFIKPSGKVASSAGH
tara:strand:+ start:1133 stop:1366 length:234 start_codon:yes stop_codon:yes gene_type:complete